MNTMPTHRGALPALMRIAFNKMRHSILTSPQESEYLTGWKDNPRMASLFPFLGYRAASIVVENGDPPPEFSTIAKLNRYFNEDQELKYRRMFVSDRSNPILDDPYLLLERIWEGKESTRHPKRTLTNREKSMYMVFKDAIQSSPETVMVSTMAEFEANWEHLTRGMFKHVNFDNVFIAGGAVVAALQPNMKTAVKESYFNSDIDVFLFGLELGQVREKVIEIYEAIGKAITGDPSYSSDSEEEYRRLKGNVGDIGCVRNIRSLVVVGQYPRRQIQIVFRLFKSPAEVLMGFDIDSCCFGYDGKAVYALPRGMMAMTRRYNLVDMTRRSASYEYRLFKYAKRGFAIAVPYVHPNKIEQAGQVTEGKGLARLLSLEAHELLPAYHKKKFAKKKVKKDRGEIIQADRKIEEASFKTEQAGDLSHYQIVKIPYGENWPLSRILGFVHSFVNRTGLGIEITDNAGIPDQVDWFSDYPDELQELARNPIIVTANNIKKNLDSHIAQYFLDTVKLMTFEETWMTENPGQQLLTGSFQPVMTTWDEWFKDAYSDRALIAVDDGDSDISEEEGDEDEDGDGSNGDGNINSKKRRLN
ncbi:hypothetical protein HDU97_002163 [Phlyctochytrium planicorne]|nr:hypothetical protein HDU97_002163 [Phlyctochytrium planicorne]